MKAWEELPKDSTVDFHAEKRHVEEVMNGYSAARQEWIETSGRELPGQEELKKLEWARWGKHVGQ